MIPHTTPDDPKTKFYKDMCINQGNLVIYVSKYACDHAQLLGLSRLC